MWAKLKALLRPGPVPAASDGQARANSRSAQPGRPAPPAPPQDAGAPSEPPAPARRTKESQYLDPEREALLFHLGPDGLPTGRLLTKRGGWVLEPDGAPGEVVNPKSRRLPAMGIWCARLWWVGSHEDEVRRGDFRPGVPVRLVREPDNEHDPSAVAVYAQGRPAPAGYVNKAKARQMAKALDAGADLVAISIKGAAAGRDSVAPVVLAASPQVMDHLRR